MARSKPRPADPTPTRTEAQDGPLVLAGPPAEFEQAGGADDEGEGDEVLVSPPALDPFAGELPEGLVFADGPEPEGARAPAPPEDPPGAPPGAGEPGPDRCWVVSGITVWGHVHAHVSAPTAEAAKAVVVNGFAGPLAVTEVDP